MIKRSVFLFLVVMFASGIHGNSLSAAKQAERNETIFSDSIPPTPEWVLERVLNQKLIFTNGKTINTHLYELKYIGQIPVDNRAPYLILSGRDCDGCDENVSIYIYSPDNGELDVADGKSRYQYPGKERDYETNALVYVTRAFYGQVLNDKKGVIWYQKTLLDNNKWSKNIFLVSITNGKLKETILKDKGELQQTLILQKQGKCKEIKGMEFTSEP